MTAGDSRSRDAREVGWHCSNCGAAYVAPLGWPRTCLSCGLIAYRNPVPVAAVLVPVDGGLLAVRRGIEPALGQLTFPGGYVNYGESWQQAAARELFEETGVIIEDPAEIAVFDVTSTSRGHLVIIIGLALPRRLADLPPHRPNDEAIERVILREPVAMAFDQDTRAAKKFFQ